MNAERWQRIEQLFHEASQLPPGQIEPWLADTCAGDRELEREVLRLLESDRHSETGVRRVIVEASHDLLTQGVAPEAFRNARIGAWRVDHLLGEGGMGLVFLAHRDDGRFEQTAAIKLLRLTLAGAADLARFRRERRILARLGHPHIARLLDAGEHGIEPGLEIPYFVMEHVDGTPLTLYASARALTPRQRVELYQQVLDAVGYAHQHFILHRDLKPENILVTVDGVVKLLDFGIASLLEGDPSGPDYTRSTLMTPDYASPEQLRGEPLTVQSDVFALGALLYELLSGRRAYDAAGTTSPTDRARAMAEKPASDLGVDGDLDTIVAKALHHDLERRYPSVEALAADLRRYLAGQPVSARRDSGWYRARKFGSRHRWPLSAVTIVLLTVAAGVVSTVFEARRANEHLAQLRQLSGRHLFAVHDALESLQGATTARRLLASTSAEYLDGLSASAGSDPAFLADLASAYQRLGRVFGGPNSGHLGLIDESIATYRKAIEIHRRLAKIRPAKSDDRVHEARAWLGMGRVQALSGRDEADATRSLQTAYEIGRTTTPPGEPMSAEASDALLYLGDLLFDRGKPRQALKYYQQALPDIERDAAAPNADLGKQRALTNTRVRIGQVQVFLGNLAAARDEFQKCVERARAIAAANPNNAAAQRDIYLMTDRLATVMGGLDHPNLGDFAAAGALYDIALAQVERVVAADPQDIRARRDLAEMHASYAATLRDIAPAKARDEYTRTLDIYRSLPDSLTKTPTVARWIAEHERGLAVSLAHLSRPDLAAPRLEHALAEFRRLDVTQPAGVALSDLAELRMKTGDLGEARRAVDEAIAALERVWKDQPDDISLRRDLAAAYTIMARIVAKTEGCAPARTWVARSEQLWREAASTEAAAYAQSELKKLSIAAPCG